MFLDTLSTLLLVVANRRSEASDSAKRFLDIADGYSYTYVVASEYVFVETNTGSSRAYFDHQPKLDFLVQVLFFIYYLSERHASRVGHAAASLLSTFPARTCFLPMYEVTPVFFMVSFSSPSSSFPSPSS